MDVDTACWGGGLDARVGSLVVVGPGCIDTSVVRRKDLDVKKPGLEGLYLAASLDLIVSKVEVVLESNLTCWLWVSRELE